MQDYDFMFIDFADIWHSPQREKDSNQIQLKQPINKYF